jgi:hypothetical protein
MKACFSGSLPYNLRHASFRAMLKGRRSGERDLRYKIRCWTAGPELLRIFPSNATPLISMAGEVGR